MKTIDERVEQLERGFAKVLDSPTPSQLAGDVADQAVMLELLFQIAGVIALAVALIGAALAGMLIRGAVA